MSSVASIALLTPIVASNAVFSVRRASRGVDTLAENPFYAAANMDIAAAQVVKGSRAATEIAAATGSELEAVSRSAAETIKTASKTNKLLSGVTKVVNFTADHINPVICGGSVIKVLGSDDKLNEGAGESIRLSAMFGSEALASRFAGMPITKKINGKRLTIKRDGYYKKLFSQKQLAAINDFCATKNYMKYAPSIAKGLFFVTASISGYNLGDKIANAILGNETKSETAA